MVRPQLALLLALLAASPAAAHGVGARIVSGPGRVVEFYYADGDAMAYADAKVFSPESGDVPYLNGRTDKLGRLAFLPDKPGPWRVEAKDAEGHLAKIEVPSDQDYTPSRWREPRTWALLLSLLFNMAAVGWWWTGRRPMAAEAA